MNHLHRNVLKTYWAVFFISLIAELVVLLLKIQLEPHRVGKFLIENVAFSTLIQLIVLGLNEAAYYCKIEKPSFIIMSGTIIASSLFMANQTIHIPFLLSLSMLVSLYYFQFKLLLFAYFVNMTAFAILYMSYPPIRESMSVYEVSAFIFIMIGMLYILRGVIQRGQNILDDHTRMAEQKQELIIRHALMDRMTKVDALTDLYNHKTFHQYLEMLVDEPIDNDMPVQLAIIDIDNFKSINDTFGHATGDLILARVAHELKMSFSSNEIVARYGGEEFAVIFPGKSLDEAFAALESARVRIWQLEHSELDGRKVSISAGLAGYRKGRTRSELFEEVDALLYIAKRTGKNRTIIPGMLQ